MSEISKFIKTTKAAKHWENVGAFNHHGIVVPLFALRCENSSGIGEYLDLKKVIDWCKKVGFDVIQLLPLNETGIDPSPYNAISSCALSSLHISLHALDGVKENPSLMQKLKGFEVLNTYQRVHYLQLKRLKSDFLREYYEYIFDDLKKDKEFERFLQKNSWLEEFALFRTIQEKENYKTWDNWPKDLQNITEKNLSKYIEKYHIDMHFHFAVQYFCFKQLSDVKKYADSKNIKILGDVPILVSKNSSDVWFNRSIFDFKHVAGAPPDAYSIYGQKWGFPLFDWDQLKATKYHWWKRRLHNIEDLYHMYRIDHVVGFFRIWCMLPDEPATEGRFFPRDPVLWEKNGRNRLQMMLDASKLLPIAEDLGLIPKIVYKTLKDLGVCGTKVIPWETTRFGGFIKFNNYEPLSITSVSTHDSDTFSQWWAGFLKGSTKFAKFKNWHYSPHLTYKQRKELLTDAHHTSSLFHINLLSEYLALYPDLVWPDIDDERINVPGTMRPTNWTYRFKPTFEEIMENKELEKDIKDILS
ncbi:MAG: 4-alpha-glucanotransferase [Candidatus Anoxychlamydiales bacterium]|nr:4-alpha-glucanotransferase [Candidatus Anoxychlamydiales bacterium]